MAICTFCLESIYFPLELPLAAVSCAILAVVVGLEARCVREPSMLVRANVSKRLSARLLLASLLLLTFYY